MWVADARHAVCGDAAALLICGRSLARALGAAAIDSVFGTGSRRGPRGVSRRHRRPHHWGRRRILGTGASLTASGVRDERYVTSRSGRCSEKLERPEHEAPLGTRPLRLARSLEARRPRLGGEPGHDTRRMEVDKFFERGHALLTRRATSIFPTPAAARPCEGGSRRPSPRSPRAHASRASPRALAARPGRAGRRRRSPR